MQDKITRLETLIENMPCNVYWMDKNCIMVGCNKNVLAMLDMSHEEYVGKTYEELSIRCNWPEGLAQKLKNDDLKVLHTGLPIYGIEEAPIPHANNTTLNLLTNRVPIRNELGEIVGVAGISVDISEIKKAKEQAEQTNAEKIEFVKSIQQDIEAPALGILAILSDMVDEETDPAKKDKLALVKKSIGQLYDICTFVGAAVVSGH